ncbi:MAG: ankyrin repeat domain-containing protein [Planctomycetota bacterium]|jgi:ankyrin repeat protein
MSEQTEAIITAVENNDMFAVDRLIKESPQVASTKMEDGASLVLHALYHGHADVAQRLAADRADLDVFEAAAIGKLSRVRELVGAHPKSVKAFAPDGFTALHLAVFFRRLDVVRFLLAQGSDVNAAAGNTANVCPIHSAAATRSAEMVRVILAAGANPDVKQTGGHTALHAAVLHDDRAMVLALLSAGADAGVANDEGKTAHELAGDGGAMAELLQRFIQRC